MTLYMASKRKSEDGKMIQAFSKINLIDLAGSEDNRRTGNAHGSAVFKESTKINLSLTVLKVSSNQNIDQGSMEQTGSVQEKAVRTGKLCQIQDPIGKF